MKKICKICGNEFECFDKSRKGKRRSGVRRSNCVTCSTKCSKTYMRNCDYFKEVKNK